MTLLDRGWGQGRVAAEVDVTPSAVSKWVKAHGAGGDPALLAKPHRGPKPKLDDRRLARLEQWLLQGPRRHGYATELWTLPRIADLIGRRFGVSYDPSGVWHLLTRMGWSGRSPSAGPANGTRRPSPRGGRRTGRG